MAIYIFNPEHDIALASNLEHFTAPHAGRCLRHDLGFLPALWAEEGDYILVDDMEAAKEGMRRLGLRAKARFIDDTALSKIVHSLKDDVEIRPWGWDLALRQNMKSLGISLGSLPTNARLNAIRQASHRAWAAEKLLGKLRSINGTTGEATACKDIDSVKKALSKHQKIVLKAPWSSSGRGVRYVSAIDGAQYGLTPQTEGWIRNTIMRQQCVMVEPYYNKVSDFGMEFYSDGKGQVDYRGLSLFHTINGAYTGNVIDTEDYKRKAIGRYIALTTLDDVRETIAEIMSEKLNGVYAGPFGIDMMVVRNAFGLALHPCVELNLRMTMGHAALALSRIWGIERQVMRITYGSQYKLRIEPQRPSDSIGIEIDNGENH